MVEIFATKIEDISLIQKYEHLPFLRLSTKRQRMHGWFPAANYAQSLTGDLLARKIIAGKLNCNPQDINISLDPDGKPCYRGTGSFHFSISHSGEWVVCAFDDRPVGVDIQKIISLPGKSMDMIVSRFFHEDEQIQYLDLNEEMKKDFFFTQWALKESYMKLSGKGLQAPLLKFFTLLDENGHGSKHDGKRICYFHKYNIDCNYKLLACSTSNSFSPSPETVNVLEF
jgi:4'-phosphopantetheinyl transferase